MGKEIERTLAINQAAWTPQAAGIHSKQGSLNSQKERVVRVRIEGTVAKLTIKGVTTGVTRAEFEYSIPVDEAAILLDNPVSYTHLDVYKRQFWWCGA